MPFAFGLLISVRFVAVTYFLRQNNYFYAKIPSFYSGIFIFVFHCVGTVSGWVPVYYLWSLANYITRMMRGREGRAGARWWKNICGIVYAKLFWCDIYCATPRPNPKSLSSFRSHRGLKWLNMSLISHSVSEKLTALYS